MYLTKLENTAYLHHIHLAIFFNFLADRVKTSLTVPTVLWFFCWALS